MSALPVLRRRIRSVHNTRQITRAMQLVAASKLRRAEMAIREPQANLENLGFLLGRLKGGELETANLPLFQRRPVSTDLTVVIGSDRGLAGAYNNAILKTLDDHVAASDAVHQLLCVGRRIAGHLSKQYSANLISVYDIDGDIQLTEMVQGLAAEAYERFLAAQADTVHLVYTVFNSTISQTPIIQQLLPLVPQSQKAPASHYEPGFNAVLNATSRQFIEANMMHAILQAKVSEQAARMVAMMNASNNASDLADDLTVAYQDSRQAAITEELAEITAGMEATHG